jgi:hypothetical protein
MPLANDALIDHNSQRDDKVSGKKQNRGRALRCAGHFEQSHKRKSHKDGSSQGDLAFQIQSLGAIERHRGG